MYLQTAGAVHASPGAIAALSERLTVPLQHVQEIYQQEFSKLAAQARVQSFLGILALRQTRAILRERARCASHEAAAATRQPRPSDSRAGA
jgi:hypothetical protein